MFEKLEQDAQRILTTAIETHEPVALIALYSGGYDSLVTTHLLHRLDTHGLCIQVWAIDTNLAADGWREYVSGVAEAQQWDFNIWDNKKGFDQFVTLVEFNGCPRTRRMHTFVFQKLKERGIDAIHMLNKTQRSDRTLFISGSRRAESAARKDTDEFHRIKKSNKVFAAPVVHWPNEEMDFYRVENGLPDNPFYDTVKGSGDCQCNWGNFITMRTLEKYSPELAAGNVAMVDRISKDLHGFGWDGSNPAQLEMFEDVKGEADLSSPFLCEGCSRKKSKPSSPIVEQRYFQSMF